VLREAGATDVLACAAHGLFTGGAAEALADAAISEVWVTDSVPAFRVPAGAPLRAKLHVASCAPLLAEAIRDCRDSLLR
jgi:ribose-phosphate pyrophosphokinase